MVRAYGEAKRSVYQELGRAEAQAELLIGISDALQNVDLGTDPAANLRKILLVRTNQIIEAIAETSKKELEAGKE